MKGILFKPDMHQATRDLLKTETRRLSGLGGINQESERWIRAVPNKGLWRFEDKDGCFFLAKPRYHAGETVFIREGFATEKAWDDKPMSFFNGASDVPIWYKHNDPLVIDFVPRGKWRSPLFLPAWAARDFIKFLEVFPQRLQEITEGGAIAEGLPPREKVGDGWHIRLDTARYRYHVLWDSINPKFPWTFNPWCWVYKFKLIKKDGAEL